jgi:hypothetical protein
MLKKSMFVVVFVVIASLVLAAYSPALAAGNGNGNGTGQAENGVTARAQSCDGTCTGDPAQSNTSSGPGPATQTGTGTGPMAQTNAGAGTQAQVGTAYAAMNRFGMGAVAGIANRSGLAANWGNGLILGPLSQAEADALVEAIEEEAGAQALYEHVLSIFGSVAPFNNIVLAEGQHLNALTSMADKYDIAVPNFKSGTLPTFATLAEACQAGVAAEKADAELYDELIAVTVHADLIQVYQNLQSASLNQHLPAFEACK